MLLRFPWKFAEALQKCAKVDQQTFISPQNIYSKYKAILNFS